LESPCAVNIGTMYNRAIPVFCLLLLLHLNGAAQPSRAGVFYGRPGQFFLPTSKRHKLAPTASLRRTEPLISDIMFGMEGSSRLTRGMAIFRLEAKVFSREKRGRSVIAAAAYRAGTKLKDELRDKIFDYARRTRGVIQSDILAPEGAPGWVHDSGQLWNKVEAGEKRIDAQLAREFILAVPRELSAEAQFQTAVDWAKKELVTSGMVAEISLHHDKAGKNPHVHILCTMRKLDGEKFSAKKPREWNDVGLLVKQRQSWADAVNAALEKAGCEERVDHRSLKDRGIDQMPQPKIGKEATAMKRRGILDDPERFKLVRKIKLLNEAMPFIMAIQRHGEIQHYGSGATWWGRSVEFMSRVRDQAKQAVKKAWQKLVTKDRDKGNEPER